jgi:hypothetical protein
VDKANTGQQLRNIHPSRDMTERLLLFGTNLKSNSVVRFQAMSTSSPEGQVA